MFRPTPYLPIAVSAMVLFLQLFYFTTSVEQVAGMAVGIGTYGVAIWLAVKSPAKFRVSFVRAVVAGTVLGLLPPRLRLGGAADAFVLFFPAIHIVVLTVFFMFKGADNCPTFDK